MISFIIKCAIGVILVIVFAGVWFTSRVEHSPNQALFIEGGVPAPKPDGFYQGTVSNLPTASWLGKKFSMAQASGTNVFKDGSSTVEQYPFVTRVQAGLRDKETQVLAIDYNIPENPFWLRTVLDEIVEVTPGHYLGKMHIRIFKYSFSILYFELTKENNSPHSIIVDPEKASDLLMTYFKTNLGTLSQIKPVLGGTWQVTNIELDSNIGKGVVYFEDGHIAAKGTFVYQFMGYSDDKPVPLVTNFTATSL